jgi:hypothetical protein
VPAAPDAPDAPAEPVAPAAPEDPPDDPPDEPVLPAPPEDPPVAVPTLPVPEQPPSATSTVIHRMGLSRIVLIVRNWPANGRLADKSADFRPRGPPPTSLTRALPRPCHPATVQWPFAPC